MENLEPTPGLLERHYGNMQDDAVIAEILGLALYEGRRSRGRKARRRFP
jgi:hypothetical protein